MTPADLRELADVFLNALHHIRADFLAGWRHVTPSETQRWMDTHDAWSPDVTAEELLAAHRAHRAAALRALVPEEET